MTRIKVPITLLACICFVGLAQPLLGQTATGSDTPGIPGFLDPRTGAFKPIPQAGPDIEDILATSTTVTGKLVFNFTITVDSTGLTGDRIVCTANAVLIDGTTAPILISESASVGTSVSGTALCTVTIPYSWTLTTMSSDKVSLAYSIFVAGTTTTTTLPNRTSTHTIGSISVPATGATTTETIKATI